MLTKFRIRLYLAIIGMLVLSILMSRFYSLGDLSIQIFDSRVVVPYSAIIFLVLFFLYLIIETLYKSRLEKNDSNN